MLAVLFIESLLCARLSVKGFVCITSFNPHNNLVSKYYYYSYFIVQRSEPNRA